MPARRIFVFLFASAIFLFLPKEVLAQVVINEFVPDANPEWVEFYNASSSAEFIKSYWLDDDTDFTSDSGSSAKKLLTGLNTTNLSYPYVEISSFLNNSGDYVVLFDSSGVIVDQYQYTSNPGSGISIGRSPDRTGDFVVLASPTKGLANSEPMSTPTPTEEPEQPEDTPTPTISPTPIPSTPTPTKKPTPTPSPVPSPTGEILSEATPSAEEASPSSEVLGETSRSPLNLLPKILIGTGILLLLISGAFLLLPKIRGYNKESDEEIPRLG